MHTSSASISAALAISTLLTQTALPRLHEPNQPAAGAIKSPERDNRESDEAAVEPQTLPKEPITQETIDTQLRRIDALQQKLRRSRTVHSAELNVKATEIEEQLRSDEKLIKDLSALLKRVQEAVDESRSTNQGIAHFLDVTEGEIKTLFQQTKEISDKADVQKADADDLHTKAMQKKSEAEDLRKRVPTLRAEIEYWRKYEVVDNEYSLAPSDSDEGSRLCGLSGTLPLRSLFFWKAVTLAVVGISPGAEEPPNSPRLVALWKKNAKEIVALERALSEEDEIYERWISEDVAAIESHARELKINQGSHDDIVRGLARIKAGQQLRQNELLKRQKEAQRRLDEAKSRKESQTARLASETERAKKNRDEFAAESATLDAVKTEIGKMEKERDAEKDAALKRPHRIRMHPHGHDPSGGNSPR